MSTIEFTPEDDWEEFELMLSTRDLAVLCNAAVLKGQALQGFITLAALDAANKVLNTAREDVFNIIDGERDHQNSLEHHSPEQDAAASVADWVIFMERHIQKAKDNVYSLDPDMALEEVRKVAALAVACMENNQTKGRANPYRDIH